MTTTRFEVVITASAEVTPATATSPDESGTTEGEEQ